MARTFNEVMDRFRSITFEDEFDIIVAIANGGIVPAGIINQRLQKEVHLLKINLRDEYQHPKYARMIKTFAVNGNADYALFDETCFKFPWII